MFLLEMKMKDGFYSDYVMLYEVKCIDVVPFLHCPTDLFQTARSQ